MGTSGKIISKASYGLANVLMKPVYNMIKEERKAEEKKYHLSMLQAVQDIEAQVIDEMKPKQIEVHQAYDSIICDDEFW